VRPRTDVLDPGPVGAARGRRIGQVLFSSLYRCRVLDADKVPASGPVLLASNHTGILDGPLVFGMAPRPAHFLVKSELFHGPVGWVLGQCGQIAIDRTHADRHALHQALAVLERGGVLGVFPEGSRGLGDVAAVHAGVTWLALTSGAPIVPIACLGTRRRGAGVNRPPAPGHEVAVVFGDPVRLTADPGLPRREVHRRQTERLRLVLAAHVVESSRRTGIPLTSAGAAENRSASTNLEEAS
jgi:1-acyl-sn-glycerol-3-phosphate acyltransferase